MFVVASILLAVMCLLPAAAKLSGQTMMRESAAHFGIAWRQYQLIGVAELVAAAGVLAGLLWHPVGIAAAVGMVVLLVGALFSHRRAGDAPKEMVAAAVVLVITIAYLVVALVA